MRVRAGFIAILSGMLSSCGGGPREVELLPFSDEVAQTLAASDYCGAASWVVRSPGAWEALWSQAVARRDPPPPPPPVDFERETVLFVSWGPQPTSGYSIEFTRAVDQDIVLRVAVLLTSPGPACVTLPVRTCPVAAVKVSRWDGAVVYVPFLTVDDCGG